MRAVVSIWLAILLHFAPRHCAAQDTLLHTTDSLRFSGQLSAWSNLNFRGTLPVYAGVRYIPTLNYRLRFPSRRQLDFEGAANVFGALATHPFDTVNTDGNITPYRAWARLSSNQWELRVGLQKINFGPATMIRPLMWFDQVDPRDPLQLTNGVWGVLGRYYFLNNANAWLWCLYGNTQTRPWDIGKSSKRYPEIGGRYQHPVPKGEMGISYHFRTADTRELGGSVPALSEIPENRIGLDGRFDLDLGLWFEAVWINKSQPIGALTNQEIFNLGTDYTFGIGKGLHATVEQLFFASDEKAFAFQRTAVFSALSMSYPLGIVDNLNAIVYLDWPGKKTYNFINWQHTFKKFNFYLMAYWNPEAYNLPQQGAFGNNYSGPGVQLMLVYNH